MSIADPRPWPIYRDLRNDLIARVRAAPDEVVHEPVPITPGWTVVDVTAHVCGLASDIADGLREGLGTPERTTHQVSSRRQMTLDAICDEWIGHGGAMEQLMTDDEWIGHRLTADLTVHRQDVLHALGEPVDPGDVATSCAAHTYGAVVPGLLFERTGTTLGVELADGTSFGPPDAPSELDLVVRATPFDWLRTAVGRRSRGQALVLDWSADPSGILADLSPYAPLPDADVGL